MDKHLQGTQVAQECPVVKCIREIRGAGYARDEDDPAIVVRAYDGGVEADELIVDDISYYIMMRKMEVARFELGRPGANAIAKKFRDMFGEFVGRDYSDVYARIMNSGGRGKLIAAQIRKLERLMDEIERLVVARGIGANISLPSVSVTPEELAAAQYDAESIHNVTNRMVIAISKLNINSLLRSPAPHCDIRRLAAPGIGDPPMGTVDSQGGPSIAEMQRILDIEETICNYAAKVERYQCEALNKMSEVYAHCKKIIDLLVSR